MSKRIKSFLITASSLFGTAVVAVLVTPQYAEFVTYAYTWLTSHGWPVAVVGLLGVLVSELWKAYLNQRIIRNASVEQGRAASAVAREARDVDLY